MGRRGVLGAVRPKKARKPALRGHQKARVDAARETLGKGAGAKALAAEIARSQHGLITRAQALEAGVSASAIARNVRSRRWDRLRRGVYCFAGAPRTRQREILEACFAAGPDAVASFFTAGELQRIFEVWKRPSPQVTLPHRFRRSPAGVKVRRSRHLDASDVLVVDGIPVTTPERTLIDVSFKLPKPKLELATMDVARRKLLDTQSLRARVLGRCTLGRKGGLAKLRAIVRGSAYDEFHESVLEASILQAVLGAGLPHPTMGVLLLKGDVVLGEADVLFRPARVVIECDGRSTHGTDSARADDEAKARRFAKAGLLLVRAYWEDGRDRRSEFVRELAGILATRTRQFAGRTLDADGIEVQPSAARRLRELASSRARAAAMAA